MWHDGDWAWGMWFMPLIWFVILAAIVVGVVFLVRALNRDRSDDDRRPVVTPQRPPGSEDALEVLRRRYAAGEIDRDEYLQKLADLGP